MNIFMYLSDSGASSAHVSMYLAERVQVSRLESDKMTTFWNIKKMICSTGSQFVSHKSLIFYPKQHLIRSFWSTFDRSWLCRFVFVHRSLEGRNQLENQKESENNAKGGRQEIKESHCGSWEKEGDGCVSVQFLAISEWEANYVKVAREGCNYSSGPGSTAASK